jgi:hypothetical protein
MEVLKCNLVHIMSSDIGFPDEPFRRKTRPGTAFGPFRTYLRYFGYFREVRDKS